MIPFNKPYYSGNEISLIEEVMRSRVLTGDTEVLKACESFLEKRYGFEKVFLTNSCTMALELSAMLLNIKDGDEVIMPSYTYISTANAFALRGAKIVFTDSKNDQPGMDEESIESLITPATKAIVVVHYGGVACDMKLITDLADKYDLFIVEDAAQCLDAKYSSKPLGALGDIGCFSFHETKNIHCGEGGFICLNDRNLIEKAEILRNKGTNRSAFLKGEVNKYEWVGLGYSSVPTSLTAAFLFAQLQHIDEVQRKRKKIWKLYYTHLKPLISLGIDLPVIPEFADDNAHLFYVVCKSINERDALIKHLRSSGIMAVFHYQALHNSPYFHNKYKGLPLNNAIRYSDCLLRVPLYYELSENDVELISKKIVEFYIK